VVEVVAGAGVVGVGVGGGVGVGVGEVVDYETCDQNQYVG
jgi:hypothetical protein